MGLPERRAHDALATLDDLLVLHILQRICNGQDLASLSRANRRLRCLVARVNHLSFEHRSCHGALSPLSFQSLVKSMVKRTVRLEYLSVQFDARGPSSAFFLDGTEVGIEKLHTLATSGRSDRTQPCFNGPLVDILQCPHLQLLELHSLWLSSAPLVGPKLSCLRTLHLSQVELCDDSLEDILSLCPNLQTLNLEAVTGLDFPHICGASLCDLSVVLPTLADGLYVTAPQLKRLCVSGVAEIELIEAADLEILHVRSHLEDLRGSLSLVEEVRLDGSDWLWESVEAVLSPIESLRRLMLDVRLRDGAKLELQSLSDSCQRAQELVLTASFLQQVQSEFEEVSSCMEVSMGSLPLSEYEEDEAPVMRHLKELTLTWDSSSAATWDVLIQLLNKAPNLASVQVVALQRSLGPDVDAGGLAAILSELCSGQGLKWSLHVVQI